MKKCLGTICVALVTVSMTSAAIAAAGSTPGGKDPELRKNTCHQYCAEKYSTEDMYNACYDGCMHAPVQ